MNSRAGGQPALFRHSVAFAAFVASSTASADTWWVSGIPPMEASLSAMKGASESGTRTPTALERAGAQIRPCAASSLACRRRQHRHARKGDASSASRSHPHGAARAEVSGLAGRRPAALGAKQGVVKGPTRPNPRASESSASEAAAGTIVAPCRPGGSAWPRGLDERGNDSRASQPGVRSYPPADRRGKSRTPWWSPSG